jgi:hypothetical protein
MVWPNLFKEFFGFMSQQIRNFLGDMLSKVASPYPLFDD